MSCQLQESEKKRQEERLQQKRWHEQHQQHMMREDNDDDEEDGRGGGTVFTGGIIVGDDEEHKEEEKTSSSIRPLKRSGSTRFPVGEPLRPIRLDPSAPTFSASAFGGAPFDDSVTSPRSRFESAKEQGEPGILMVEDRSEDRKARSLSEQESILQRFVQLRDLESLSNLMPVDFETTHL